MLTLLIVLAVRALLVLAVVGVIVGVAMLVRRRLRRTGRWYRVQELVHSTVVPRPGVAAGGGPRALAIRMLLRWIEGGPKR